MNSRHWLLVAVALALPACKSGTDGETLAGLDDVKIEVKDVEIEGGLEKAIESYRKFLEATPESAMTPEAIRRLADLKIEKEYGLVGGSASTGKPGPEKTIEPPAKPTITPAAMTGGSTGAATASAVREKKESEKGFEQRATAAQSITPQPQTEPVHPEAEEDLQKADAVEAIALYQKLLAKYPLYERNDQVLYQMARAYEELGEVDEAMTVMNRLVKEYPKSRYIDEVQFRRGEYFFTRKKFIDSEEAYSAIADMGSRSFYYELGLYKLGWSFYKQEMYEDAQHKFIALLDHKVSTGYDFEKSQNEEDKQRVDDTFRVISLGFSNLGGSDAVIDYFSKYGRRPYEVDVYSNLGEHYLEKRRYNDAAGTFKAFVKQNPFHKVSPRFDMRVIEIYKEGGFPQLVIDANKEFARSYGLKSEYWNYFDVNAYPEVLGYLKANLKELANHYHARYQDKSLEKEKSANFAEALHWYDEYLSSFPKDVESPVINYQLADLLLENKDFGKAAQEYERTAYGYPAHDKASAAGYASVYAYREHAKVVTAAEQNKAKREVIRISLKFADSFPAHEKAAIVLGAATDDLFAMKDYPLAVATGRKLIQSFPKADPGIVRSAWTVVAHSSFELANYTEAEEAYVSVLKLTPEGDKSRVEITDNLAASIYKQGEEANKAQDFKTASTHFLRIAQVAPASKIRPVADYDGATALMQLKEWDHAADVLQSFRKNFPEHQLQADVTKKIAYVYKESGKLSLAAAEYERIEVESKDDEVRRGALLMAADLYQQADDAERALQVYKRYVAYFPKPLELALEARFKVAEIYKARNNQKDYIGELKLIIDADARAGNERTDRTRYLAGTSALVVTEPLYEEFAKIKLVKPFDKNLARKKTAMKTALDGFGKLPNYEVGEVTAAAAFYLAEVYFEFSTSLKESERPENLSDLELEQYEEAIDEQAYPFEEKSIKVHEKNLELLELGIYNVWVDKSLEKLAKLVPARYAKFEESSGYLATIDSFSYAVPAPAAVAGAPAAQPAEGASDANAPASEDVSTDGEGTPGAAGEAADAVTPAEGATAAEVPAAETPAVVAPVEAPAAVESVAPPAAGGEPASPAEDPAGSSPPQAEPSAATVEPSGV